MKIEIVLKQFLVEDIYFGFEILSKISLVFIPSNKFRTILNKKYHKRLIKYEN